LIALVAYYLVSNSKQPFISMGLAKVSPDALAAELKVVPGRNWKRILAISALVAITGLITGFVTSIGLSILVRHLKTEPSLPKADSIDCGNSASEARDRGCLFNIMTQTWQPPQCYDHALERRILAQNNFIFYRDINVQKEMPFEQVAPGEHTTVFASDRFTGLSASMTGGPGS
jgi:hypothetical protein